MKGWPKGVKRPYRKAKLCELGGREAAKEELARRLEAVLFAVAPKGTWGQSGLVLARCPRCASGMVSGQADGQGRGWEMECISCGELGWDILGWQTAGGMVGVLRRSRVEENHD